MCAALLVHARIDRLVFGAFDPKAGAVVSPHRQRRPVNHSFTVTGGVLAEECGRLLREFFQNRRRISVVKNLDDREKPLADRLAGARAYNTER